MTALRSNGPPQSDAQADPTPSGDQAKCLECGGLYAPQTLTAEFCGSRCRQKFHNRIQARGVILYSLYMACRFDRGRSDAMKLWSELARCASSFRREDLEQRAGRRSWRKPAEVLSQYAFRFVKVFRVRG